LIFDLGTLGGARRTELQIADLKFQKSQREEEEEE
jgi:hypothetical protein